MIDVPVLVAGGGPVGLALAAVSLGDHVIEGEPPLQALQQLREALLLQRQQRHV